MNLREAKAAWTDGMRAVARQYPSAVSSKNWPEICRLANSGDVDGAKALAARAEVLPHIKAHNVIARRLRIERAELFVRVVSAERALGAMLAHYTERVAGAVEAKGHDIKNIRTLSDLIHDETVSLRASLRIWFGSAIRDTAKMAYRHIGDAILPIFKASRKVSEAVIGYKAVTSEFAYHSIEQQIIADRAIFEGRLMFTVSATLAARGKAKMTAAAIAKDTARIIVKVADYKLTGLKPSQKIWDLTARTEQDLKRMVASNMAAGENPAVTARKIKKYISPRLTDNGKLGVGEVGQGVYRSPYRNAMRLARTEMNRTYTQAQQSFVAGKPWLMGSRIDLSPAHSIEDDCDDQAGRIVEPGDTDVPPFHPHCMCVLVPQIDPKYLGADDEEAA